MPILQERACHDYDADTCIAVETRNNVFNIEYALLVNNRKYDQITGFMGNYRLRGYIPHPEGDIPLTVHIRQRMFSTRYTLEVNGKTFPMVCA